MKNMKKQKLSSKFIKMMANTLKKCEVNIEVTMTTENFLKRLQELYNESVEISRKKNADYAGLDDPFKNFRACENLGICSTEKGILVRMTDKLQRATNLIDTEAQVKDESILDTLQDLANYSMILRIYLETKKK